MGTQLVQFQCSDEGSLFYYQHTMSGARSLIDRCPICGSGNVAATGRTFPKVDEGCAIEEGEWWQWQSRRRPVC